MPESLMDQIRAFEVPKKSVGIWWLGQNGYIFKSSEGTLASVDLYLSDSCGPICPEVNLYRQVPILIRPEDVQVHLFTCTHNHQDHTDPETIRNLHHKDTMEFVGPPPSCDVFRAEGIEKGRIVTAWPDCVTGYKDITVRGTFALPTDDSDLNHMGFVFEFGIGPKIYVTGDTDFSELLYSAGKHKPDLVITCINGGFNNLSHWEAAELVRTIKPKAAIPCHYDMFPDNSVDPKQFRASLNYRAPDVKYTEMEHGKPLVFGL